MRTIRNYVALAVTSLLLMAFAVTSSSDSSVARHTTAYNTVVADNIVSEVAPVAVPVPNIVATAVRGTPEEFYHSVWQAAERNFLWRDRLADWPTWEHKFDGKLATFEDAESAINQMLATLNDGYTYYKDATVTAGRAARADERNVVSHQVLPGNIGYIKIRTFGSNHTAEEMEAAINALNKAKVGAFIIDLRDNGGGYVHQAFKMFSMFVDDGLFTTLKGHYNGVKYTEELFVRKGGLEDTENGTRTSKSDRAPNLVGKKPVVILVNGSSASASEMFSGALRDAVGAALVGSNTYGKGIAQTTISLERATSIQVTFAEYFLPKGDSVHGKGIAPTYARPAIGPTDAQLAEAVRVAQERMKP